MSKPCDLEDLFTCLKTPSRPHIESYRLWGLEIRWVHPFAEHPLQLGNKLWKLYGFYEKKECFDQLISCGSSQANSLLALSLFCHSFKKKLSYLTPHIPSSIAIHPNSNYKRALAYGAHILDSSPYYHKKEGDYQVKAKNMLPKLQEKGLLKLNKNALWVEQGLACKESFKGLELLSKHLQLDPSIPLCLPSGTGSTALGLASYLPNPIYTTPCLGFFNIQSHQHHIFQALGSIKLLKPKKNFSFGKLHKELLDIYREIKDRSKIQLDLLYDAVMFHCIKEKARDLPRKLYYLHCGGLEANESMLARYQRKFF